MKKIIIFTMLLIVSAASFSQSTANIVPAVKIDYLEKSRKQKTAAWLLLGGGTILVTAGSITAFNNVLGDWGNGSDSGYETGMIMFYTGGAAMLGSIPLFMSAARNKGRSMAASASLKMEKVPVIQQQSFIQNSYPAVSLKISL